MADYYIGTASQGTGDGSSWANRIQGTTANIQAGFDQLAAGDTLYFETGTYTLTSTIDVDQTNGAYNNPISVVGLNGSGVEDNSQFTLDGDSSIATILATTRNYYQIRHMKAINSTGTMIGTGGNYWIFYNCWFQSSGTYFLYCGSTAYWQAQNCYFSSDGLYMLYGHVTCINCQLINGVRIHNGANGSSYVNCIIHNFSLASFVSGVPLCFVGNTVDSGINGVVQNNIGRAAQIVNNRFTNISGTAIHTTSNYSGTNLIINNAFYNNGTNTTIRNCDLKVGDISLTAEGYTDRANDDFTLTSGGEGTGVEHEIGLLSETTNLGYFTAGLNPEASGGGGGVILPNMNGGMME